MVKSKNNLRILAVSEFFPPCSKGGGEQSAYLLLKNLAKRGCEVDVLTSQCTGAKEVEVKGNLRIFRKTRTGSSPSSVMSNVLRILLFPFRTKRELKKLVSENKYDIVHYFNMTSAYAYTQLNIPSILHVNSPVFFDPKADLDYQEDVTEKRITFKMFFREWFVARSIGKVKLRWYLRYNFLLPFFFWMHFKKRQLLLRKFDYYVAISKYMKKRLELEGINRKCCFLLPNIVEFEKYAGLAEKKKKGIVYVGAYTAYKGVYLLLEALKDFKDVHCDFYGSGCERGGLIDFVNKHGLNVTIHGPVSTDEIPQVFSRYKVSVIPSLTPEAFGRVAIEAMAAGCIPVASRIGGLPDIISHEKNGFLFEKGSTDDLKRNLRKALGKAHLLKGNAVKRAKQFSGRVIARRCEEIYQRILR